MSNAFDVFKDYIALKNHFTTKSYDYFKYQGKSKSITVDKYNQRKDKVFFMKLAKHKDYRNFLVANFIEGKSWIGDLAYNEQAQTTYTSWLKRTQSLTYIFTNEIEHLDDDFDKNFVVTDNQHPYALKLYLQKKISIETLVILIDIVRCFSHWQKNLEHDIVWKDESLKLVKYKPFIHYEKSKLKKILLDRFRDS